MTTIERESAVQQEQGDPRPTEPVPVGSDEVSTAGADDAEFEPTIIRGRE